jgi:LacI family transcriptional regulator
MTVSRVLSGAAPVSAATRARVSRAISQLRYQPNAAARQLASGATHRLGLLYVNPSQAYLSELLVGALAECAPHGMQLVLGRAAGPGAPLREISAMLASGIDAFLLPPSVCDQPGVLRLLRRSAATWAAVSPAEREAHPLSVSVDDLAAAQRLTAHLIELGHRRIGFIIGDPSYRAAIDRRDGYLRALADAGLAPGPMVQGSFSFQSGLKAAERILTRRARCTAIFASNDDMAAGAIASAYRAGLRVPRDISIVGFDDTPIAATVSPAITTMRQPVAEMARAAVRLLVRSARRGRPGTPDAAHRSFHCTLLARQSCAPPRGGAA